MCRPVSVTSSVCSPVSVSVCQRVPDTRYRSFSGVCLDPHMPTKPYRDTMIAAASNASRSIHWQLSAFCSQAPDFVRFITWPDTRRDTYTTDDTSIICTPLDSESQTANCYSTSTIPYRRITTCAVVRSVEACCVVEGKGV